MGVATAVPVAVEKRRILSFDSPKPFIPTKWVLMPQCPGAAGSYGWFSPPSAVLQKPKGALRKSPRYKSAMIPQLHRETFGIWGSPRSNIVQKWATYNGWLLKWLELVSPTPGANINPNPWSVYMPVRMSVCMGCMYACLFWPPFTTLIQIYLVFTRSLQVSTFM